jgi:hypothetical protein
MFLALVIYLAVGDPAVSKYRAERICSEIKLGMTDLEISKLAEEKGARVWRVEKDEIVAVAVVGFMNNANFCRIHMNNGSVTSVGTIEKKPGRL